jgi:hypothetical protein
MNIKLPSGKNISKSDLKDFKNEVNKIIYEKIAFKNSSEHKSFAQNIIIENMVLNQTN